MTIEIKGEKRERLLKKPAERYTWREWVAWAVFAAGLFSIGAGIAKYILG